MQTGYSEGGFGGGGGTQHEGGFVPPPPSSVSSTLTPHSLAHCPGGGGGFSGGCGAHHGHGGGGGGGSFMAPNVLPLRYAWQSNNDGYLKIKPMNAMLGRRIGTCGARGRIGPTDQQCKASYSNMALVKEMYMSTTTGIQRFKVCAAACDSVLTARNRSSTLARTHSMRTERVVALRRSARTAPAAEPMCGARSTCRPAL